MNKTSMHRLEKLRDSNGRQLVSGGFKGIEKESLRISDSGYIAQTPHPAVLGAALTHPHITTDYSEALLEFITPPFTDIQDTLAFLHNIHQFVYDNLQDEMLLAASMPCGINGDDSIPIAEYGNSNIGTMKHVYRRGLAYRYGRTMQSIAGIHFNFSVPEKLWPVLQKIDNDQRPLENFISESYFALLRNFQHVGWIMLYLFGASPAICKSFFKSRPNLMAQFDEFDSYTLYHPYATSLRMSDIGYKSTSQAGLNINYNSLQDYVCSLCKAIETPYPEYDRIGIKVNGEYRQLNSNILQIENEYYSTARPKQIAKSSEKPTLALQRRGVRYIEIRSLDLDLHNPIGIDESTSRFIEALMISCLLQDSPLNTVQDLAINNENQLAVAHQGRNPGLQLRKCNSTIPLQDWANEIMANIEDICALLDESEDATPYGDALNEQQKKVDDPSLTPSARILAGMKQKRQPFATYALEISQAHKRHFTCNHLPDCYTAWFRKLSRESDHARKQVEANDDCTFDEFLHRYFAQTCS